MRKFFGEWFSMKCTHKSGQKTRFRVFSKKERVQMMKFNQKQIKKLAENTNVLQVLEDRIFYTPEFKLKAIQEYEQGKTARQIFIDAGFNLSEISTMSDYASKIVSKWRFTRNKNKNNIHYPKMKIKEKQSDYQKMAARLEYLEAENEFLKKLQFLIQSQK